MASTHFVINESELQRLCKKLDLKIPVHVQGSATRGRTHGRYHGVSPYTVKGKALGRAHHQITLSCDTPASRLVETLIHECQHAAQEEKGKRVVGMAVSKEYNRQAATMQSEIRGSKARLSAWDTYWTRPIEVEARAVAEKLKAEFSTLLSTKALKEYVVTGKYSDEQWLVKGARSPAAAGAKVASRHYGDSRCASMFRVNVRQPAHGELTNVTVINWKAGR